MFLLPGLVIGSYVTGMSFLDEERLEMIRYVFNHAHPDDGGWGLYVLSLNRFKSRTDTPRHIEGHSTAMGTALNYAALRLLGVPAEHPVIIRARATLHKLGGHNNPETYDVVRLQFLGGAAASASWGKFWLSVLNVYDWEGNNPIPPELWYVEYANQHIELDTFLAGYYLIGSLSTRHDGGYILARYTYLWVTYTV